MPAAASQAPSAVPGAASGANQSVPQERFEKLSALLDTVCQNPARFSPTVGQEIGVAAQKLLEETPRSREGLLLMWRAALSLWNCVCVPVTNATAQASGDTREMINLTIGELRIRVWCA